MKVYSWGISELFWFTYQPVALNYSKCYIFQDGEIGENDRNKQNVETLLLPIKNWPQINNIKNS